MPKLAANLSWLFTERPFLDRFAAAADAGFDAVEMAFPYDHAADAIASAAATARQRVVLVNLPPGAEGERGIAALPGRESDFVASLDQARRYADALGAPRLHALAGVLPAGAEVERCRDCYLANLAFAAERLAEDGRTLLIEPINHRDVPGYLLVTLEQAIAVVAEVGAPNLRIQADLYHLQIEGGDVLTRLKAALPLVGHIQIAGVPDRSEPNRGELAYPLVFEMLDAADYAGWIGCEYRPAGATEAGLAWAAPWLNRAPPPAA